MSHDSHVTKHTSHVGSCHHPQSVLVHDTVITDEGTLLNTGDDRMSGPPHSKHTGVIHQRGLAVTLHTPGSSENDVILWKVWADIVAPKIVRSAIYFQLADYVYVEGAISQTKQ